MKIELHSSILVARKVLTELRRVMRDLPGHTIVRHFANAREQGYVVEFRCGAHEAVNVTFAEYRNSDDIVVYFGDAQRAVEFAELEQETAVWETARFFRFDQYTEAALAIRRHVQQRAILGSASVRPAPKS